MTAASQNGRGRFLRLPEVKAEIGLSRTTIYRLEEKGEFPKRGHLSARAVGWWSDDVDRWKSSRPQHRSDE